ncbi:MAG TPA: recombinase family protein [Thermoanaerobaculia bacterium]|jgi:DNA invertase Pin-like site-specific DNA recombinase|nr:recombinase family protein [Thermoanaerobaculia bacterium]
MSNTYYGYIRVSTSRQGERGVSLQEQREAIERFAAKSSITISRWFEERETAAKRGRPIWNEMLQLLRRGSASGLVIHKIDRSARNLRDWADLQELMDRGLIQLYFANEALDLTTRGGRLSADIQAVVATDYIRNLKEEALKGIDGRLRQGILPLPAPIGYIDCGAGKPKTIDPVRGPLVRRAFELYATGSYNLHRLREAMQTAGLRNRRGGLVSINGLSTMLRNPFYFGLIRIKRRNATYEGVHVALIHKSLFDRVQAVLDGKFAARSKKHDFLFRRTLRCKGCGYSLIGETQKGYIYYRCHTPTCPTASVREEATGVKFHPFLEALQFLPEERAYLREKIEAMRTTWKDETAIHRKAVELQLSQVAIRRGRLTDALVDGLLEREPFEERQGLLLAEKKALEEKLAALSQPDSAGVDRLAEFLERLDSAYSLYQSGTTEEMREIIAKFTSNWVVEGKRVDFTPLPEAQLVSDRVKNFCGGPQRDRPRTWDTLLLQLTKALSEKSNADDKEGHAEEPIDSNRNIA